MAKSDLVPCFYKEQDATWERPAKLLPRSQVREIKAQKLGAFIFHPDGAPLNFNLNVKFIASRHKKETSSGQS